MGKIHNAERILFEGGEIGMSRAELIKKFSDYVYYFKAYCTSDNEDHEMLKAVLALLKEQEAVEPRKKCDGKPQPWSSWWYVCGDCGQEIEYHDRYCRWCGQAVKWE